MSLFAYEEHSIFFQSNPSCQKDRSIKTFKEISIRSKTKQGIPFETAFYLNERKIQQSKKAFIFINGGPGYSSQSTIHSLSKVLNPSFFPLVFFDQRGTGCSSPKISAGNADKFKGQLQYFTAPHMAKDIEALIDILKQKGISEFHIFAHSYGGRIALEAKKLLKETVKYTYIFGYYPFEVDQKWLIDRQNRFKNRLTQFNQDHMSNETKMIQLRRLIPDDVCVENDFSKLCGKSLFDSLYASLGFQESWPKVDFELFTRSKEKSDSSYFKDFSQLIMESFLAEFVAFADYHVGVTFTDYCRSIEGLYQASPIVDECRFSLDQSRKYPALKERYPINPLKELNEQDVFYLLGLNDPFIGSLPEENEKIFYFDSDHGLAFEGKLLSQIFLSLLDINT